MNIHFSYLGSTYKANLTKEQDNKVQVIFNDKILKDEFGSSLQFFINEKTVEFITYNRCHSNLFALNSSISKAIKEQLVDLK
jgi:hypothetical protein